MFVLLGYMDCILVQYKSGTIIKQQAMVTTGSTTMNLIVKVPTVMNTSEQAKGKNVQSIEEIDIFRLVIE